MVGFIYIIRNTVNDKVYIGQTRVTVEKRWKEHLRHAAYGEQVINRAMKKYGIDKFYIETLEVCDAELLDEREMYYIALYDSTDKTKGYNVSIGGNTPKFKGKCLDIPTLIDLYINKRFSLQRIGEKFGVSCYIIKRELVKAGIEIRDRHDSATRFSYLKKEDLLDALELGASLRGAAKLMEVPYPTFRKSCLYHGIEYNSSKSVRHPEKDENVC